MPVSGLDSSKWRTSDARNEKIRGLAFRNLQALESFETGGTCSECPGSLVGRYSSVAGADEVWTSDTGLLIRGLGQDVVVLYERIRSVRGPASKDPANAHQRQASRREESLDRDLRLARWQR